MESLYVGAVGCEGVYYVQNTEKQKNVFQAVKRTCSGEASIQQVYI